MCSSLLFSCCRPGKRHFTWAVGAGLWRRMAAEKWDQTTVPSAAPSKTYTLSDVKLWEAEPRATQASKSIFHWFLNLCPNPACELHLWPFSPILHSFVFVLCLFLPLLSLLLRPLKHCRQFKKLKQSMQLLLPTRWNRGAKSKFCKRFFDENPGSHMPHSEKYRICEIFGKRNPFHLLLLIQLFAEWDVKFK